MLYRVNPWHNIRAIALGDKLTSELLSVYPTEMTGTGSSELYVFHNNISTATSTDSVRILINQDLFTPQFHPVANTCLLVRDQIHSNHIH